jgi:hypothetical protein
MVQAEVNQQRTVNELVDPSAAWPPRGSMNPSMSTRMQRRRSGREHEPSRVRRYAA